MIEEWGDIEQRVRVVYHGITFNNNVLFFFKAAEKNNILTTISM